MSLTVKIARVICSKAYKGFCSNVGGDLGCKVGRGTSDHSKCIASDDQLLLSGYIDQADKILAVIEADKCS